VKTTIDHCRFNTTSNPFEILAAIRPAMGFVDQDLVTLSDQSKGEDGWTFRRKLMIAGDAVLAEIDYGGQNGQVRCNIRGSGCAWIQDWAVMEALPSVLADAFLKRVDVALTMYQGEVTHQKVLDAHAAGQFINKGRPPHYRALNGSDQYAGRTIYVGSRKSAKYLRCYEKGLEMLKDCPLSTREFIVRSGAKIQVDGVGHVDPLSTYRVEVEFKDKDDYVIPWNTLHSRRDEMFAGAYPFCASLLPGVPIRRMQAFPDVAPKLALASALDHCRRSYGATIRAAALAFGGDMQRVFDIITSEKPAEHLIAAGVLLVDHVQQATPTPTP